MANRLTTRVGDGAVRAACERPRDIGQVRASQVRASQVRVGQVRAIQVHAAQVRVVQVCPGPMRYPPCSIHPAGSDCGVPAMPPLETPVRFALVRFALVRSAPSPTKYPLVKPYRSGSAAGVPVMPPLSTSCRFAPVRSAPCRSQPFGFAPGPIGEQAFGATTTLFGLPYDCHRSNHPLS